ncbi:MAG: hypothetical protein RL417_892 [Pseudomonadota bacterium]|jgi:hypothetical protein
MRERRKLQRSRGIALLEMAILGVVAIPFIITALAVVKFLEASAELERIVVKSLNEERVMPFTLRSGAMGEAEVVVRYDEIDTALEELIGSVAVDLYREGSPLNSIEYRIDATLGIIGVDEVTGEPRLHDIHFIDRSAISMVVPNGELERIDIHAMARELAELRSRDEVQGLLARESPGGDGRYLRSAAVLGVRLFKTIDDGFLKEVLAQIGLPHFVSAAHAVAVRTEVFL